VIAGFGLLAYFTLLRKGLPNLSHSHAGGTAIFAGDLADPLSALAFAVMQLPNFLEAILPAPWGVTILLLVPLSFSGLFRRDPLAPVCRSISACALIGVALMAGASVLGVYPFGGIPRHSAPVVPALIVAAYLSVALLFRRFSRPSGLRTGVASILLMWVASGIAQGLLPGFAMTSEHANIGKYLHVETYRASEAPLVVNVGGRVFMSWWFLPNRNMRLREWNAGISKFDLEGVSVLMTESPKKMLEEAVAAARREGESWILHTKFSGTDRAHFMRASKKLEADLRSSSGVRVGRIGRIDSFPFLATYQLIARSED
jgi:hypothetical protein